MGHDSDSALPSKPGKSALGTRLIRNNQASGKIASFHPRLLVSAHETREYFRYKTGGFARYNSKTCRINSYEISTNWSECDESFRPVALSQHLVTNWKPFHVSDTLLSYLQWLVFLACFLFFVRQSRILQHPVVGALKRNLTLFTRKIVHSFLHLVWDKSLIN